MPKNMPIIVDLGSSEIKAGFSGEESPKIHSPNYIGELKNKKKLEENQKRQYISDECDKFAGNLNLHFPIEHGVFKNTEDIYLIFNYIFSKLGLNEQTIKEHQILISEPLHNQESNREKISEILFEKMDVQGLIFGSQPLLSLFSTSYTTGVILESGDAITQSCVSYEGYLIPSSCFRYDYGGRDVTNALKILLDKNNYNLNCNSFTDMKIFKNIKEKQCYLKINQEEGKYDDFNSVESEFILPDGNRCLLKDEKIIAPEILFNNRLNCSEYPPFHEILFNSISKADINIKNKLYSTVILSGGNTLFRGMEEKTRNSLKQLAPKHIEIKIRMNRNPQLSCWNGGNVVSSLNTFKKMIVTQNDWKEHGKKILFAKCI
jgi:centractin